MRYRTRWTLLFISCLLLCGASSIAQAANDSFLPAPDIAASKKIQLWATFYKVQNAREIASGIAILDLKGKELSGPISPSDWCNGAIEGTINVTSREGKVTTYNYVGRSEPSQIDCAAVLSINPEKKPWIRSIGESRFKPAIGKYGDGVNGYALVPYHTLAVDPSVIPFGTVLFIPSARNTTIKLPDGQSMRHDGYFFAADRGGAIHGHHVDVFCGLRSASCFPKFTQGKEDAEFTAYVIDDPVVRRALETMHRP